MLRKTFVEINLASIKSNLLSFRKLAGESMKILLPVKADAYGHGITEVSKYAEENRLIDMLGVATLEEGIELREAGVSLPILVMGLIMPAEDQYEILTRYTLTQTIADYDLALAMAKFAADRNEKIMVHLKVDTGMGRIGCRHEEAAELAEKIFQLKNIALEGIYSHFPVADEDTGGFSGRQIGIFKNIISNLDSRGITIPFRHIANSAGVINFNDSFFNMIRPGVMAYGYAPRKDFRKKIDIIPSMTLKSSIIFMKRVPGGTPLSYGLSYTTEKDSNIATLPVGYGDGYPRALSNRGKVIIRGRVYPVAGRVTMDQILIDLGNDNYPVGEEVILFGSDTITANEIAEWAGTISYEITCNISKRVPRIYIR